MDGHDLTIGAEDDLYLMTNVHPKRAGLPFLIYLPEKGNARYDARVEAAGSEWPPLWRAVVSVRPQVELVEGELSAAELKALTAWIALNRDVVIAHWDGGFDDSADVIAALQPLP